MIAPSSDQGATIAPDLTAQTLNPKEAHTDERSNRPGTNPGDDFGDRASLRHVVGPGLFDVPSRDEAIRVNAAEQLELATAKTGMMPAEIDQKKSAGISHQKNTESFADVTTYTELPGQLPVQLPGELPVADDDFFDNETYRIELEFEADVDRTKVQVRLRAKGPFRYSIMVGNYYIGKLTKRQLARAKNKTLPASVKRAIKEGNLDDELIYRILARRGKGESGDTNKQGRKKGIRGSNFLEGARTGREVRPGNLATTGRRQSVDNVRGITQSQRIN